MMRKAESWAPPPPGSSPSPPRRAGERERGWTGQAVEDAPAAVPFSPLPPLLCPYRRPRGTSTGAPATDGDAPQSPISHDPQPPLPQQRHMQPLCDSHRAPACKSCQGPRGLRQCCSRHHEGHPRLVLAAGGARQRMLFGSVRPAPPLGGRVGIGGKNGGEAPQRSGAVPAPTVRSWSPRRGHWRAKGADT